MNQDLEREIEDSLYIHRMLPLHREKSLEAAFPKKKIVKSRQLWGNLNQRSAPEIGAAGNLSIGSDEGEAFVEITAPVCRDSWPEGAPSDGDYSNYGSALISFTFEGENWEAYHRLHFQVKPQVTGAEVVHLNVSLENDGVVKVPDAYAREGFSTMNLENYQWNDCYWEFSGVARDCVVKLNLYVYLNGKDVAMGDTLPYRYKDICVEQVELPEKEHGWECQEGQIVLSSAGYLKEGSKTAVGNGKQTHFTVHELESEQVVLEGSTEPVSNERGSFQVFDFSAITKKGTYYICWGETKSQPFTIGADLVEENTWRVLNFLYGERCGMPVTGKHGTCHQDITASHNGKIMSFSGGWHDAGDVSQQSAQTGEIVQELLEMAEKYRDKKPRLYLRIIEEASWGLDFILRTRFGDGYRATSAGATRFTNGLIGDMDDVKARVYNHAYENFLFAGIEAYASRILAEADRPLSEGSLLAAQEDYQFAMRRFREYGMEPEQMFEHTYNSGLSQYYAVIVWSASLLYQSTGKMEYAREAESWCEKLLLCQDTGDARLPFEGFFYRDETKSRLVHFNHQSREHQFIQALVSICQTQPDSPKRQHFEDAMRRYAGYLKAISQNTKPYGMIPAGIYAMDEYLDKETFPYLHVLCSYEDEKENYLEQLCQGRKLSEKYVLRNFPVWFSFRGNNLLLLSQGKAASMLGRYFEDETLLQIGREQLYWIFGKNPFGQSMMYGAGSRYPSQYAIFPGECVGEMPVGIETKDNEDLPYWPQGNNATYKEVWVSAAGRWLLLAADYA
ncbi:MAG: glycoside hydrolase family 9 protein [Lachnospiraceae bacterium]|nr:glycoside hydrolase family 9 protein [Lachnospiraceae bacterium]